MRLIILSLSLSLFFCSYASGEIIFQDDFESYAVGTFPSAGGWGEVPFGTREISTDYASSGSKSLRLIGPGSPPAGASVVVTISDYFVFECSLYIAVDGNFEISLYEGVGPPNGSPVILQLTAGKISAGHMVGLTTPDVSEIGNYTVGVWYKIKGVVDLQAQTYDVYINDSLIASSISTAGYAVDVFNLLSYSGDAYFDDVNIYAGTALALDVDQDGTLESNANLLLCQDQTVSVDLWLSQWDSVADGHAADVDYYFTWDTEALDVLSITINNLKSQGGQWDTSSVVLVSPGKYRLGVEELSSGIPDQDIKLHTVELQCIDAPRSGWIKASILPDGGVQPVSVPLFSDVSDATGTMSTICDGGQSTCTEETPCEVLEGDDLCPETAIITKDIYEHEPAETTFCGGDTITILHTKTGEYIETEYFTPAFCGSGCFEECFDNCTNTTIQVCYLRCIKGCTNGACPNWDEPFVCYEYQNRINCNVSCWNQCYGSYDTETQAAYYDKICGFSINELISVRASDGTCTGEIISEHNMIGAGTTGISLPLPLAAGNYDLCAGATKIDTIEVTACGGATCILSIPTNVFVVDQGVDRSLQVTLSNASAAGTYMLHLDRWLDDAHTIPLTIPGSLDIPSEVSVGENSSTSFTLSAVNPQMVAGQSRWTNIIIRAENAGASCICEAPFDFDVASITVNQDCERTNEFLEDCTIYGKTVLGLLPNTAYPLYVVEEQTSWVNGMTIPASCTQCSTSPETSITTDSNGDMGCGTVLWQNARANTLPAEFDIVIDVNGNGLFDVGTDFLDANTVTGFTLTESADGDGICDYEDNCPNHYNPDQEDPDQDDRGDMCDNCPLTINPFQENSDNDTYGDACDNCPSMDNDDQLDTGDGDGVGDLCDNCQNTSNPNQRDTYPPQGNNIGDACDCEADFNCDQNVDGGDIGNFLDHFGRSQYFHPCTNEVPCYGDVNCDTNVDGGDVGKFLEDFGRSQYFNPCPPCEVGDWCVYP